MNPLISYLKLLRFIPPEDEAIITAAFEPQTFKEGEFLFRGEGRVSREVFFVRKGVIRIASVNDAGLEVTHVFYNENKFCTILQSFNDEVPAQAFIQACCDAEVQAISKSRLMELYKQVPYLKQVIDQINQLHLIEKVNTRNSYLGRDAEDQYKLFVMQNPDIAFRVALKDIASYLGITPQSLSRIRKHILSIQ